MTDSRAEAIFIKVDEKGPLVIFVFIGMIMFGSVLMLIYDGFKGLIN